MGCLLYFLSPYVSKPEIETPSKLVEPSRQNLSPIEQLKLNARKQLENSANSVQQKIYEKTIFSDESEVLLVISTSKSEISKFFSDCKKEEDFQAVLKRANEEFSLLLKHYTEDKTAKSIEKVELLKWRAMIIDCIEKACQEGPENYLAKFEALLKEKPSFINNTEGFYKGTILIYLATIGKPIQFVKLFEKYNADFTITENDPLFGNTALLWAIANANNEMAIELIKWCPREQRFNFISKQCKKFKNSPLHLAIAKGYTDTSAIGEKLKFSNYEITKELIKHKPLVNCQNIFGDTPLHLAAARRDIATIQLLLNSGARWDIKNKNGKTALDMLNLTYEEACQVLNETVGNSKTYKLDRKAFEESQKEAHALFFR